MHLKMLSAKCRSYPEEYSSFVVSRERVAAEQEKHGFTQISSYKHRDVIAGQVGRFKLSGCSCGMFGAVD